MSLPLQILSVVVLLGGLIFIHELGHFLVAKAFGVKVLKFSLGFGPRVVGFRKGETEYCISLLPLGGFVKMAGDDPSETVEGADAGRGFLEQKPWKRACISFAGPAMNLVFPLVAYFAVFALQTESVAPHVGQVMPDMPAAAAGLRPGDRIVEIDGERVYSFADVKGKVDVSANRELRFTVERDGRREVVAITPQPYEEVDPIETVVVGKIGVMPNAAAPEIAVAEGSPAAAAGLRTFDRIASVNGEAPGSIEEALAMLRRGGEVVALRTPAGAAEAKKGEDAPKPAEIRATLPSGAEGIESAELYVRRVAEGTPAEKAGLRPGDKLVALDGEKLVSWAQIEAAQRTRKDQPMELTYVRGGVEGKVTVRQAMREEHDEVRDRPITVYTFGAYGGLPALAAPTVEVPFRPLVAAKMAFDASWEVARKITLGIGMIVTGEIAFKNVGGPLQIYDITTQAAEQGWEIFLHTMAMISINLGLVNLFPVPVLDGGHIVQAAIEGVRRKPLSLRAREITNAVGFALLLLLMVSAITNDVVRYFFSG